VEAAHAVQPCQLCGRGPARELVIRRHVGMLVLQRFVKAKPHLCRDCGKQMIKLFTLRTLWQGWWGAISFWANIFTIVMNLVALKKANGLGAPQLSSPLEETATEETKARPGTARRSAAFPVTFSSPAPQDVVAGELPGPIAYGPDSPRPGTPEWDDALAAYAREHLL
jgi:hypothetical protein